ERHQHHRRADVRDREPARQHRGQRDPQGRQPDGQQGRGPRPDGPERVRQEHPRLRPGRPPVLRGHRRGDPLQRRRHLGAGAGRAGAAGHLPRLPIPDRDPRRLDGQLPPDGGHQRPQRPRRGRRGRRRHRAEDDPARVPPPDEGEDGAPEDGRRLRHPLPQRGVLRRREEARRNSPDGAPGADDGDPRRDRLRPRHRRPARGLRGRQLPGRAGHGRAADHPLPAPAQPHQAGLRPHHDGRPDRPRGRPGTGPRTRSQGLRDAARRVRRGL
ncbi:MAG: Iron-sulfur cluster assembly ATPase protein SufC, partial [uncultured Thermomicrobiales bacterium]